MKLFSQKAKKRRLRASSIDELTEFRQNLPVYEYRKDLLRAIGGSKVIILTSDTGSGKSTQIPAYLLGSTHRIAVTQPRRVAAVTLASRVALENQSVLGHQVGYRVRFDDCSRSDTQLTYLTDGMLLREAMVDPFLRRYSVIFLDEAHERSLQTDILFGVVYRARKERKNTSHPLQVVVMSATLEISTFRDFFGADEVISVNIPGRTFPVQILYTAEPVEDYIEASLATILQIHYHEDPGDILVFLPGQEEIEDLALLLRMQLYEEEKSSWTGDRVEVFQNQKHNLSPSQLVNKVLICLLYAALAPEAQIAAFDEKPPGCDRKIILATNIAETSVTLPSIKYVIDPGKFKCRQITPTGMESLTVEPISKAQAAQRAGRAGRVSAGLCFRLYTEDAFEQLQVDTSPEILRVSLSQVVLQLKGMGIDDPTTFDFVTKPNRASLARALKLLFALEALDKDMNLTEYGKKLAKLPLDPVFGHLLCQSAKFSCVSDMLTVVSVLSADNLFYRPPGDAGKRAVNAHRRFASHEGDFPSFLNVYTAWQREANYIPPGNRKAEKQQAQNKGKLSHSEWCQRNYISGRALSRAYHVREQLKVLCARSSGENGLEMDVTSHDPSREQFLKCAAAGLFLQAASRIKEEREVNSRGKSGSSISTLGRYRTKTGNEQVSIHPTSTIFGRNPAPACVVYTELVTTKKSYIRGVTQIREEWLHEVAPAFYPQTHTA